MFLGLKAPQALPPAPQANRPACFSRSLGSGPRSMLEMIPRWHALRPRACSYTLVCAPCAPCALSQLVVTLTVRPPKCKGIAEQIVRCGVAHSSAQYCVKSRNEKEQRNHQKSARTTAVCRTLHDPARRVLRRWLANLRAQPRDSAGRALLPVYQFAESKPNYLRHKFKALLRSPEIL